MRQNPHATYQEVVDKLRSRYGYQQQQEKFRVELRHRRRKQGESLQELAEEVEKLVSLAYPQAGTPTRDILGRDAFIDSLDFQQLQMNIREREPASLKETLILAMKLEVLYQSSRMEKESQKVHVRAAQQDKKVKDRDKSPARGRRTVESSVASKDGSLRDDVSTYLRLERQDR